MTPPSTASGTLDWPGSIPLGTRRDLLPRSKDAHQLSVNQLEIEASFARSRYFSSRIEALKVIEKVLNSFWQLERDWNSYGAEPPHRRAMDESIRFSSVAIDLGLTPDRVEPSAEGGVAIAFVRGDRRAIAEFLNDGSWDLLLYDKLGNLKATNVEGVSFEAAVKEIRDYVVLSEEVAS